jgi:hypothetical protein
VQHLHCREKTSLKEVKGFKVRGKRLRIGCA